MASSTRRPLIAANWKMHKVNAEAIAFMNEFTPFLKKFDRDVLILPPFTSITDVGKHIKPGSTIHLGGQNVFHEKQGAYTGEISGDMLHVLGCEYVLVGHSERRNFFKETDLIVNKKVHAALEHCLIPIVCVGEHLEQREAEAQEDTVRKQLKKSLAKLTKEQAKALVIAYEPIWAIGTGKNASPHQAQEMHLFIRKTLAVMFGEDNANHIRILYGGSVKPENAKELMQQPDIDGLLVGGASLDVKSFVAIANF